MFTPDPVNFNQGCGMPLAYLGRIQKKRSPGIMAALSVAGYTGVYTGYIAPVILSIPGR